MFDIPLHEITVESINRLVSEHATESQHIEFKRQLPDWSQERAIEEMMGDISAFGNTAGGYLIYGIVEASTGSENTKCASGLINAIEGDEDALVSRITQLVRSRIEPRGFEVQIKVIECSPGTRVLVLRIPESYRKPLRVQSNGKWFFRYNNLKSQMEYQQIRDLFVNSDRVSDRVRAFREERLCAILSNDSIAPFATDKLIVYHFIPMPTYQVDLSVDLSPFWYGQLAIPQCNGIHGILRPTIDGIAFFGMGKGDTGRLRSKTEIFRSGVIEMVDAFTLSDAESSVRHYELANPITNSIQQVFRILPAMKLNCRVAFFLSILNVGGLSIADSTYNPRPQDRRASRRNLHFPEYIFDATSQNNDKLITDTQTLIENAFGTGPATR